MTRACAYVLALSVATAFVPAGAAGQEEEDVALVPQPSMTVADGELRDFAWAWRAVTAVRDRWRSRLKASDEEERRRAMAAANAEMRGAVEASPLSVERYNELVVALQGDPAFRRRVARLLEDAPQEK